MKQFALKYGLVGPVLVLLLALNVGPLLYNLVLAFTNAELIGGEWKWVGVANFSRVFNTWPGIDHGYFSAALRTTAVFVFAAVGIELLLGFGLALCLRDEFRGKTAVLTVLLVPMMLSPAVMGLYWSLLLNGSYGIVNQGLGAVGLPQPQWLTNPSLRMVSILIIDIWMWTPFMMLIALAGLNAIPPYIYEAAEIDRASRWTVFRRITLPMCAPLLGLAVLFRTTDALKQFDLVMAITGSNDTSTQTLSAMTYETVFRAGKVGLGSAYATVVLVMVIAIATLFTRYIGQLQKR